MIEYNYKSKFYPFQEVEPTVYARKEVGEEISCNIQSISQDCMLTGKVIYVHPENRFYTVRFPCHGDHSFCESFIVR